MADPTLVAAKKLRAYEEAHPVQAIVGGFTPGIGQASAAAALRDPDAPWWEKGLNTIGLVPGIGGVGKAMVIGAKLAKGNEALEGSLKAAQKLALKMRKAEESADPSKGARGISDLVEGDPRINDQIFKETGWWYDPDSRKWMTELDDSKSMPDFPMMEESELNQVFGRPGLGLSLGDVLKHPELEKLPEGRKFLSEASVERNPALGAKSGEYDPNVDVMSFGDEIDPKNMSSLRDVLLHEPQHAIAKREGFMRGTNSQAAGGFEPYMKDPGELLARITALRRNMTPEARRKLPFHRHLEEERYRLSMPGEAKRYATQEDDLKRALKLRNLDPEEMLVPGP